MWNWVKRGSGCYKITKKEKKKREKQFFSLV